MKKVQVKDLRKGDVLSSGAVITSNPVELVHTPKGKVTIGVRYPKESQAYARTWGKYTEVTVEIPEPFNPLRLGEILAEQKEMLSEMKHGETLPEYLERRDDLRPRFGRLELEATQERKKFNALSKDEQAAAVAKIKAGSW